MSIFKHHEHDSTHEDENASPKDDSELEAELEEVENPEDVIEQEREEAVRREVTNVTPVRPPGI